MPSDFAVGVSLNLAGSVAINLGTNLIKLAHTREAIGAVKPCVFGVRVNLWTLGAALFASGNVLNFVSFSFAAQSLLAALGSVQFITNVVFGAVLLNQHVTPHAVAATGLIVLGNLVIMSHASQASQTFTADELLDLYFTPRYEAFVMVAGGLVLGFQYVYVHTTRTGLSHTDCHHVVPFSFAAVSAIIGSQSVLLAKSTSELVRSSFLGQERLATPFALCVLAAWALTMAFWLYRMNVCLRRFDTLFIVPVLQVIWTLSSIVGGGLYFDEFANFTLFQAFMFVLGVGLVIGGVCLLASSQSAAKGAVADQEKGEVGLLFTNSPRRVHSATHEHGNSRPRAGSDWEWARDHAPSLALTLPLFDCSETNPLVPPDFEMSDSSFMAKGRA